MAFPVIDLKETGLNIWRLREEAGISTRDLGQMLGLTSPTTIYRWQSGVYLPTVEHLHVLSMLFKTPMEKILVFKEDK